jgi:hypothetical protein
VGHDEFDENRGGGWVTDSGVGGEVAALLRNVFFGVILTHFFDTGFSPPFSSVFALEA